MTKRGLLKRIGAGLLALAMIAVLAGASWEAVMRRSVRRSIPMPGRLVDVGGGRRQHLDCRGHGAPTVCSSQGVSGVTHTGSALRENSPSRRRLRLQPAAHEVAQPEDVIVG